MLAKISEFVKGLWQLIKEHANTILLVVIIALFILLSFALGYIIAKYQDREPIIIHQGQ